MIPCEIDMPSYQHSKTLRYSIWLYLFSAFHKDTGHSLSNQWGSAMYSVTGPSWTHMHQRTLHNQQIFLNTPLPQSTRYSPIRYKPATSPEKPGVLTEPALQSCAFNTA